MQFERGEEVLCTECGKPLTEDDAIAVKGWQAYGHAECLHEEVARCENCERDFAKSRGWTLEVYDSPFDDAGRLVSLCSDKCEEEYFNPGYSDFHYELCPRCDRYVCVRSPSNGWHYQFKDDPELPDEGQICLRCYEDLILESGQPESNFKGGSIGGGSFFSYGDLAEAGWEKYSTHHIRSAEQADSFNRLAREHLAMGRKVLVNYERMGIGGMEGTVELWVKKEAKPDA